MGGLGLSLITVPTIRLSCRLFTDDLGLDYHFPTRSRDSSCLNGIQRLAIHLAWLLPPLRFLMSSVWLDLFDSLDIIGNGSFGIIRKVRRRTDGMVSYRATDSAVDHSDD